MASSSNGGDLSTARAQSSAADGTADGGSLTWQPGAGRRDEAAGLKVGSSMGVAGAGVAGGMLLAEEVRDGPAPPRPADATPGPAICCRCPRCPAGVPTGASSPSGGVKAPPVLR